MSSDPVAGDAVAPVAPVVQEVAEALRSLPSLVGSAPTWEAAVDDDPVVSFARWLRAAGEAGVAEPHAMTLSTVGEDDVPDARVLILKDLRADGRWGFASSAGSVKGRQLARSPVAALTFYWPQQLRSVRIRGVVERAEQELAEADFVRRSPGARAVAVAGPSGGELDDPDHQTVAVAAAVQRIEAGEPVDHDWALWWVRGSEIEFWQGSPDRQHLRLRHRRTRHGWTAQRLWS